MQGANLEQVQVNGANFQGANLRGIPWLIVKDLMVQPEANFTSIQWDNPIDDAMLSKD
ncbi:hypothetical protein KSX_40650 [Ktedonospora formicarum]|uniref:Pentapeptide repeat-containing protein n=1 Tax=Ktedonospora formicarum TaxID=2778364 RepID=A0A8J3HXD5_9CHLR|nr:hypothetical protein KSX_40650 [Ktedonospora formicarum]